MNSQLTFMKVFKQLTEDQQETLSAFIDVGYGVKSLVIAVDERVNFELVSVNDGRTKRGLILPNGRYYLAD